MKSDLLEIHYREKIQYNQISITWDSAVVEQAVEADGKPGAHAISIHLILESIDEKSTWALTLPSDYKEFIEQQPEQVSYSFASFLVRVIDADFNPIDSGFIRLEIEPIPPPQFQIDYKPVTEKAFTAFLKTLKEIKGTWFCAESTEGGITGYDATDKDGVRYKYRAESKQRESINSITRLPK